MGNVLSLSKMLILLWSLSLLAGCGGDARVAKVHGNITLDGEPVVDAAVTFMPAQGGRPAFGITDADGTYELMTFAIGDGALIGDHIVTVTAEEEQANEKAETLAEEHGSLSELMLPNRKPKQVWLVPERYSDSETSGLQFSVERGTVNKADFELTNKP